MQDLLRSGRIYWINSPQNLKKWVERDLERRNILQTIVVKNKGRGHRYYFESKNVEKYLEAFHNGNLDYQFDEGK